MSYHENEIFICVFVDANGLAPFKSWLSILDDYSVRKVVMAISKVQLGILSHCKSLGQGLWEIKIHHGSGIRVYFGKRANEFVLLWGGTKKQQSKDIVRAQKYWFEYLKKEESITWH